MLSNAILSRVLLLLSLSPALLPAAAHPQEVPMASLPLQEILRLYKENEAGQEQEEAPPPFAATVNKAVLSGRLLAEAVELEASFEVAVLGDGEWVSVPLLKRGESTHLSTLPRVGNAVLAVDGEYLSLVTRHRGIYNFEVAFVEKALAEGRRRTVVIDYGEATLARLLLHLDQGLFRLDNATAAAEGEGMRLDPEDGRFTVSWQRIAELPAPKPQVAERPPIESVVTAAHGSAVSTLEGKAIVRLAYDLRFEGSPTLVFELPPELTLERLYRNGMAVPFTVDGTRLELAVEPRRAGDQSATVELVFESDHGGYNLSGGLVFELPRVSWPVNELYFDVHLPQVFNYTWTGGSLAPVEPSPAETPPAETPEADFTYAIPRPGKRLTFHQYLISKTSPNLRLDYAIDLEGKYFREGP